jgi:hypothetical protein
LHSTMSIFELATRRISDTNLCRRSATATRNSEHARRLHSRREAFMAEDEIDFCRVVCNDRITCSHDAHRDPVKTFMNHNLSKKS